LRCARSPLESAGRSPGPKTFREGTKRHTRRCRTASESPALGFRLLSLIDEVELSDFLTETLAGLLHLEPEERADLLHTLEVLLEVQLNVAEASRRTHYHYNTMRYRISKLERLVGPFTTDGGLCLRLSVALQILQMQQAPNG
jgi:purine catabolism regulator